MSRYKFIIHMQPTFGAEQLGKYFQMLSAIYRYEMQLEPSFIIWTRDFVSIMKIFYRGTPAWRQATASFQRFPSPAMKGFEGKSQRNRFIMLAFTFPVFLSSSFERAGTNSQGSMSIGPSTPTVCLRYVLEQLQRGRARIVSHTILYPFLSIPFARSAYPSCRQSFSMKLCTCPPISFLVTVPSTSLTTNLSLDAQRYISVSILYSPKQNAALFTPNSSCNFLMSRSLRYCGWMQPLQSKENFKSSIK